MMVLNALTRQSHFKFCTAIIMKVFTVVLLVGLIASGSAAPTPQLDSSAGLINLLATLLPLDALLSILGASQTTYPSGTTIFDLGSLGGQGSDLLAVEALQGGLANSLFNNGDLASAGTLFTSGGILGTLTGGSNSVGSSGQLFPAGVMNGVSGSDPVAIGTTLTSTGGTLSSLGLGSGNADTASFFTGTVLPSGLINGVLGHDGVSTGSLGLSTGEILGSSSTGSLSTTAGGGTFQNGLVSGLLNGGPIGYGSATLDTAKTLSL